MRFLVVAASVAMVIASGGIGCAHRSGPPAAVDHPAARTWIGEPVGKVVEVWGPCSSPESDGNGGSIYVYRERGREYSAERFSKTGREVIEPRNPEFPGPVTVEFSTEAKFWVNPQGKVYRYWFADSVWKNRPSKTRPP